MVKGVGPIQPYKKEPEYKRSLGIEFYSEEILKMFLISQKIPTNIQEKKDIEKISKNLSMLTWIGQLGIVSKKDEKKVVDELRDLKDNFHLDTVFKKTSYILQNIKNINRKTQIMEHVIDISYEIGKQKNVIPQNILELQKYFDQIMDKVKVVSDKFAIMKLERDLQDIKKIYLNNPKEISLLLQNLEKISKL